MYLLSTTIFFSRQLVLGFFHPNSRFFVISSSSLARNYRSNYLITQSLFQSDSRNTQEPSQSYSSSKNYSQNYLRVDSNTMSGTEPNPVTVATETTSLTSLILPFTEDRYDGVIINSNHLPETDEKFEQSLEFSLEEWRQSQRRGIWLKIPLEKSSFIPIAVRKGFVFHHAEKNYAMLTHWLDKGESRLPQNASHQVGVGCIVIHEGKILLVQEKSGPLKGSGVWKLPTGVVEVGEDISVAAEREVLEETGVQTKFMKLLSFRQAHGVLFGKSDLFFVCVLEPITIETTPQEAEIHACEWKEPEALFDQEFFRKSPLHTFLNQKIKREIISRANGSTPQPALKTRRFPLGFRPGDAALFFFDSDDESSSTEK